MKKALLAVSGLAACCVASSAAWSSLIQTFNYTDKIVDYTVPTTGAWMIEAAGAHGGAGYEASSGSGALVSGNFLLDKGEELQIAVGGVGAASSAGYGGGGGGSFVVEGRPTNPAGYKLLAIAGGGGGGGFLTAGQGGQTTISGGAGGGGGGAGGTDGNGGSAGPGSGAGAGGGGYASPGQKAAQGGGGGGSFVLTLIAGTVIQGDLAGGSGILGEGGAGGFGGGGGAGDDSAGGGGGYSGGGGGGTAGSATAGGGGGSILEEAGQATLDADFEAGNGFVELELREALATGSSPSSPSGYDRVPNGQKAAAVDLTADAPDPVPEPGSAMLLGVALVGLAALRRRAPFRCAAAITNRHRVSIDPNRVF